ncbi:hypothetical protein EDB19DRAFT_970942 [Suillus lakei]|nr:hypothetical protein EDB19DRAFT_970942 [Suillus lakei]
MHSLAFYVLVLPIGFCQQTTCDTTCIKRGRHRGTSFWYGRSFNAYCFKVYPKDDSVQLVFKPASHITCITFLPPASHIRSPLSKATRSTA